MNVLNIQSDLTSIIGIGETLSGLLDNEFGSYEKMHRLAKEKHKSQKIHLAFGSMKGDVFVPFSAHNELQDYISGVLKRMPERYRTSIDVNTWSEIVFFEKACGEPALKSIVRKWINRISSYNYGVYSPTMQLPDKTPVGFWAAFFYMLNNEEDVEVYINYLNSLRVKNEFKRKWGANDKTSGFLYYPSIVLLGYVYEKIGWNTNTLKLLGAQISNYAYVGIPDLFYDLFDTCNPATYLKDQKNREYFTVHYIKEQKAVYYDQGKVGGDDIVEKIFPMIIGSEWCGNVSEHTLQQLGV